MPERYLEENRYLYFESGLGSDVLLLESFTGAEGVSRLFSFQLELLSENDHIPFDQILGKPMSFGVLGLEDQEPRHFHGIVTAFTQLPDSQRLARYRAIVSPALWTSTCRQTSRIFQKQTAAEIVSSVLQGVDFVQELQGSYDTRDYCVQYRESDFNFISRLMEEEGIFYFFRFAKGSHQLVLADNTSSFRDMPGGKSVLYEEAAGMLSGEGRISDWVKTQQLVSGKYTLTDYIYGSPSAAMDVHQQTAGTVQVGRVQHRLNAGGNDGWEVYDFPGRYGERMQAGGQGARRVGDKYARTGIEQMEVAQFMIGGKSNRWNLTPGYRFSLLHHPKAEGDYTVTAVTHSGREGGFHSAAEIGHNHYSNIFECIPASMPFRPPRTALKPQMRGCQTAVVVGPSGEEIYTDDLGRIKVQFHWDRDGKKDGSNSCWVRVASFWAGKQWGAIHLPRIGHEVVVDFLEGDPDCPIVVGSVYNGGNMPPYDLPANRTQSGIISRSSKGGGPANFNQLRFEDKKGSEEVLIHAEKDMNTEIEHDETWHVGHDRTATVDHDETCTVKHDHTTTINHNESHKVGNTRDTSVTVDDTTTIGKNMTLKAGANRGATIGANDTETVGGNKSVTVTGSESLSAMSRSVTLGGSDSLVSGGSVTITSAGSVTITSGGAVTIMAPMITLTTAMLQVAGVVQCTSVVSPAYTPGAGNMM
jgi:type VI secretion system secreted protein VgrG